jgi:hypothetical protein
LYPVFHTTLFNIQISGLPKTRMTSEDESCSTSNDSFGKRDIK